MIILIGIPSNTVALFLGKLLMISSVSKNIKEKLNWICASCLMYFKIQSDQPRITQNALKIQIFDLFTKSSSGHK